MAAKLAFLHDLAWGRKLRRAFRIPLLLGCTVSVLPQVTPAQDSSGVKNSGGRSAIHGEAVGGLLPGL